MSSERISRDDLFIEVAKLFGRRSTCERASVGAIAVRDRRIISSGYVGSPSGRPHCLEAGCRIRDGHCISTVHAEANLVAFAAKSGTSLGGTTVYSTHSPCYKCAQLLVNAGITELVYADRYWDDELGLLTESGVNVRAFKPASP